EFLQALDHRGKVAEYSGHHPCYRLDITIGSNATDWRAPQCPEYRLPRHIPIGLSLREGVVEIVLIDHGIRVLRGLRLMVTEYLAGGKLQLGCRLFVGILQLGCRLFPRAPAAANL